MIAFIYVLCWISPLPAFGLRLKRQHTLHYRMNMNCPMFDALPKGKTVGTYRVKNCVGKGIDGEAWKASTGDDAEPVVLKVLRSQSSEKARHECSFAMLVHKHLPDQFVDCIGTIDAELSNKTKLIYSIFELADGKDLGEWLQTADGETPMPLPNLASTFELSLGARNAVETLERGFGQVRYMHDDAHLGNVILNARGSWKLIDYGRTRICCDASGEIDIPCTDPPSCEPAKSSAIIKFANWLVLVTSLGPDIFSWPAKVQAVYLGGMRGVPAGNVTAIEALEEFLPTIREAYQSDFKLVEANDIVEKGFEMMLVDRFAPAGEQKVLAFSSAIKALSVEALSRLEAAALRPLSNSATSTFMTT